MSSPVLRKSSSSTTRRPVALKRAWARSCSRRLRAVGWKVVFTHTYVPTGLRGQASQKSSCGLANVAKAEESAWTRSARMLRAFISACGFQTLLA